MPCIVAKHAMSAGEEVGTLQNLTTTTKSYKTKILQKTKSYRLLCGTVMISTTALTGTWMLGRGRPSQSLTPCAPNMDSVDTSSRGPWSAAATQKKPQQTLEQLNNDPCDYCEPITCQNNL